LIFGSKWPASRVNSIASKEGWYYQQYRENIEAVRQNKLELIEDLVYQGLGLTKLSFQRIQKQVEEGKELSADDLSKLVGATQKLHTMGKLEAGESTQNVAVQVEYTLDGINKLFLEAKEAELDFIEVDALPFKEITAGKNYEEPEGDK
jgi:uncharacterized protein YhfF